MVHRRMPVAPDELRGHIDRLLKLKRSTPELELGPPIPEVGDFIRGELVRHGDKFTGQGRPDLLTRIDVRDKLNQVFRDAITSAGVM